MLDLTTTVPDGQLPRFFDSAVRKNLVDRDAFLRVLGKGPGWAGIKRLRALVEEWDPLLARSRSDLEMRFLKLCRKAGLPDPAMNARVGGFEVDFIWKSEKLIVEVDGYKFHSSQTAFEVDHTRDADLKMIGFDVLRFTYRRVMFDPDYVVSRLKAFLMR